MTLTLPQLEVYEKHYRRVLQADEGLPAALADVAAFWAAPPGPLDPDPLDLPPIATWLDGPIPFEALLDYADTFPAVAVEATSLTSDDTGPLVDSLLIHVYVSDGDPGVCHRLCQRYSAACAEVAYHQIFGIGVKERAQLSITTDEVVSPESGAYLKSAFVRLPLHIVGRL
jgi:hypothetical protein